MLHMVYRHWVNKKPNCR